jgi:hypothetical protein
MGQVLDNNVKSSEAPTRQPEVGGSDGRQGALVGVGAFGVAVVGLAAGVELPVAVAIGAGGAVVAGVGAVTMYVNP